MSARRHRQARARNQSQALVFAALGNATRLTLVAKLCGRQARSISELTQDFQLTRQAITKHLRVLESAGIVHSLSAGRETRFTLDGQPLVNAKQYLGYVSEQWDRTLARLKAFVEK